MSVTPERNPRATFRLLLDRARRPAARIKHLDSGLFLALLLGLFVASPFLARASLPGQTDAELHVYRTAELSRLVGQGVLYPRWASNLYLGYGYPLFHYYAPFTYHLGHLFYRMLPGASVVTGTKAVFVCGLLLASVGAYLLGRELFGPAGGIVASASFALAPYVAFIDPLARGDLAEHFAVSLLPLAFYFFHKLMTVSNRWSFLGSVLLLSILVFSHNLLGLVGSGLLLAYWIWQTLFGVGFRRSWRALVAFALAAGLIAFFWLPALIEYDAVKLDVVGPGHFDFREHFSSLAELLAPSRRLDWGAVGPRFRYNLGVPQWILALAALVRVVWRNRSQNGGSSGTPDSADFFFLAAPGLIFLMLPTSAFLWEAVPPMAYLQFPWRLLGPANLMLAVCAASAMPLLPPMRLRTRAGASVFVLLLAAAFPLLYPAPWPSDFGGTEPLDIIQWEVETGALGTTSSGDFLPTSVDVSPRQSETLISSYETGGPIDKVNRATLKDETVVTILSHGPRRDVFHVTTPRSFVLRLYTFNFPGWEAYVDGERVAIEVARPEGFITVPVPQGEHEVLVYFRQTPIRRMGWVLAASSLVVLCVVLALWSPVARGGRDAGSLKLPIWDAAWFAVPLLLASTLRGWGANPWGWAYVESPPGAAIPAQRHVTVNFDGEIELLGYGLPRDRVRAGDALPVVLYWRALRPLDENYQSFVHVAQPLDRVWAQEDHLNPGGLPTERWPTDQYVWDEYEIQIPEDTPPGEYKVNVGVYLRSENTRLKRLGEDGQPVGDALVIGAVTVIR